MSTKIKDLLDELANQTEIAPATASDTLGRVRRRQRRRLVRGGVGLAAAASVVTVAVAAFPALDDHPGVDATGPSPAVRTMSTSPLGAREFAAAASAQGSLFVWGGRELSASRRTTSSQGPGQTGTSSGRPLGDGATYDPATNAWSTVPPSPLAARESAAAVETDAGVVVVGGRAGLTLFNDAATYSLADRTWTRLPSAPNCPTTGASFGGSVIVGGACGPGGPKLASFDLGSQTWTTLPDPPVNNIQRVLDWNGGVLVVDDVGAAAVLPTGASTWTSVDPIAGVDDVTQPPLFTVAQGRLIAITIGENSNSNTHEVFELTDVTSGWAPVAELPGLPSSEVQPTSSGDLVAWSADTRACFLDVEARRASCPSMTQPLPGYGSVWLALGDVVVTWGGPGDADASDTDVVGYVLTHP